MSKQKIKTTVVSTLMAAMFSGLALTGCSTSVANVEPTLGKIHSLLKKGDRSSYSEACDYVAQLDTRTRNSLTTLMLKDKNPLIVYMGASRLVTEKMYDAAAPVMAELIVNGQMDGQLEQRMEQDWQADHNAATWPTMMSKVGRILTVNMDSYLPDSKNRAQYFLITTLKLETNKPFNNEDAPSAIIKLSRDAKTL